MKKSTRPVSAPRPAQTVFLILLTACAFGWSLVPACGSDRNWTGADSANWSDPNNWSPLGTPQNGDSLHFGEVSDANRSMNNDIVGLAVSTLYFDNNDYRIDGNAIIVSVTIFNSPDFGFALGSSHTTTINCDLSFPSGGYIVTGFEEGHVTEDTTDIYLNGNITVGGPLNLLAESTTSAGGANGHIFISGEIFYGTNDVIPLLAEGDGDSAVIFDGSSELELNLQVIGTVVFDKSGGSPPEGEYVSAFIEVTNGNHATLEFDQPDQFTDVTSIEIDSGSQVFLTGDDITVNTLILNNDSADADPSTLDTGFVTVTLIAGITASVDNDHVHPTIGGNLFLGGSGLPFDISGGPEPGLEIQAGMGDAGFGGGLTKGGDGTLWLDNTNDFSGAVLINAGTVEAFSDTALGLTRLGTDVELNGGNLVLDEVDISRPLTVNSNISVLSTINDCSWTGPVTLNADLNVIPLDASDTGAEMNFSGSITGSGGLNLQPALFGVGNVQLSGTAANTFNGATTVNCQLLELNKPYNVAAYGGALIVGGETGSQCEARWLNSSQSGDIKQLTLYTNGYVNLTNNDEEFASVTFNGGTLDSGPSGNGIVLGVTVNPSGVSAVIDGNLILAKSGSSDVGFNVADGTADPDLIVNASVTGGNRLAKEGAGTMSLTAVNSFSGAFVEGGILDINNGSALGTATGTVISDGATLRLDCPSVTTMTADIEVLGTGVGGTHGAIEATPANVFFTLAGNMLLDSATTVNAGGNVALTGTISGTGPLTKTGTGILLLGGTANNTYTGNTVVSAGTLLLDKAASANAVPNNLVIGPASGPTAIARLEEGGGGGIGGTTVTVNGDSLFDLNGLNANITQLNLNDGGSVQTGTGVLNFLSGGSINVGSLGSFGSHVSASISGIIGLPANAPLTFNVNPAAPFFPFPSGADLEVSASIPVPVENVNLIRAGIVKQSLGRMHLSAANTYAGFTTINGGTLLVDGSQSQSTVSVNSGTLSGTGTVGPIFMNGSSAIVAPGDGAPGILNCGNVNSGITASGIMSFILNGPTVGTGYSQLNVTGTVNLAGVTPKWSIGYTPSVGQIFDIISNDGTDAVTGRFNGLPGGFFYIGADQYQISYIFGGKPGNDVSIEKFTPPPSPNLYIQEISPTAVQLSWQTNNPNYNLQYSAALASPAWSQDPSPASIIGTNYVVTDSISNSPTFYRLSVLPAP